MSFGTEHFRFVGRKWRILFPVKERWGKQVFIVPMPSFRLCFLSLQWKANLENPPLQAGCLRCLCAPDPQLGPEAAPSLKPHNTGTRCRCCRSQPWQGLVWSAGLRALARLCFGISHVCSEAEAIMMEVGYSVRGWLSHSAGGRRSMVLTGDLVLTHPSLSILSPCPGSWAQ